VDIGETVAQRRPHRALVLGVREGEQKADGHGVHLRRAQPGDDALEPFLVQRLELALGAHALADAEAQLAGDQRGWTIFGEVVQRGPVLTRDLQHVAKPRGRDQRCARAATFQQCVGGNGHTVREGNDICGGHLGLLDRHHDALRLVGGGGRDLGGDQFAVDEGDQVREGAPDVHSQPRTSHAGDSLRAHSASGGRALRRSVKTRAFAGLFGVFSGIA